MRNSPGIGLLMLSELGFTELERNEHMKKGTKPKEYAPGPVRILKGHWEYLFAESRETGRSIQGMTEEAIANYIQEHIYPAQAGRRYGAGIYKEKVLAGYSISEARKWALQASRYAYWKTRESWNASSEMDPNVKPDDDLFELKRQRAASKKKA